MANHRRIKGDCLKVIPRLMLRTAVQLVIADPPYSQPKTINMAIRQCTAACQGACFFFMYPEDLLALDEPPQQILHWIKQPSTKNTTRSYSRFVEVIAAYNLHLSPFCESHWSARTGVFNDGLVHPKSHPHQKPESLIEKLVVVNSKPNWMVLDPFAGSGTVARVCKRLGRNSISIDIEG